MTKAEVLSLAVLIAVGVFTGDLIRVLGWHWLAFWPVYPWAFLILTGFACFAASAVEAFVRGFKRGFNRGNKK